MARMHLTKQIAAPVDPVFAVFTNIPEAEKVVRGIQKVEMLTPGAVGRGTRWRETRMMFGKSASEVLEFTDFQPGRSVTIECDSCGSHFTTTYRFTPEAGGTRVDMEMETSAHTFFAKLMSPLGKLMAKSMKRLLEADLTDVEQAVIASERGTSARAASAS